MTFCPSKSSLLAQFILTTVRFEAANNAGSRRALDPHKVCRQVPVRLKDLLSGVGGARSATAWLCSQRVKPPLDCQLPTTHSSPIFSFPAMIFIAFEIASTAQPGWCCQLWFHATPAVGCVYACVCVWNTWMAKTLPRKTGHARSREAVKICLPARPVFNDTSFTNTAFFRRLLVVCP
ncbi:uncharacterized protein BCR38DRAFT_90841 [Pseudomassariella vexata]|uniref:Uncharacterized protein n=1 Tax=Pseudomassariella vexata TaxID=1141098 RepID=A0A1Y2EFZ6_9PEZI|nr:uncharacterized protein BCR38DRAFT_90841 [Pseudomassariella vexata]ORY69715.1 hypothetical protein BCR38DRAFT_90841 [Pseudomassariella vexata]